MPASTPDPTIRREVIAAARHALAADPDASVGDISRRAGISRATFYRHFGSRTKLLETVAHEPRPDARTRILASAQEMLMRQSMADISMDDLARAADISRGTLYRIFPGKAALMDGLIDAYSPLEPVRTVVSTHASEPPSVVLPLIARAIVGSTGGRLGLVRAMFLELTSGSEMAISAMRPTFAVTLGIVSEYMTAQMDARRMRRLHPLIALQAFIGPILFHLLSRPVFEQLTEMPLEAGPAIDELVGISLDGLLGANA